MSDKDMAAEVRGQSLWQQHKFMVLVGMTILIALMLVAVALRLYSSSGAAQLDLSRPGYQSVRKQAGRSTEFAGFPSSGPLDKEALDTFRRLYDEQLKEATAVESFGGDVMSDAALGLDQPAPEGP